MKRIIWIVLILVAVGAGVLNAGDEATAPMATIIRICDGIGRQYSCVSSSHVNKYGFGGRADTLSTDSTVARGCQMNVHRVMEASAAGLSELLPAIISSQSQLDSSYMFSKWSSICWSINSFYASSGGLSGKVSATTDSGRLSPRFAQVARANGIYLAPKTVYPDTMNLGYLRWTGGAVVYADSGNIDSTRFGASPVRAHCTYSAGATSGTCTLKVWGSNQNLVHGRCWRAYKEADISVGEILAFTPLVATDSLYAIDSLTAVVLTSGGDSLKFLLRNTAERIDSL